MYHRGCDRFAQPLWQNPFPKVFVERSVLRKRWLIYASVQMVVCRMQVTVVRLIEIAGVDGVEESTNIHGPAR